jgi:transforming growth factor-beta-induced protein
VLLYHVASGKFMAADLIKSGEVTTLQGKKIKVEQKSNGDVILNGIVKVTTADIPASNGVIHVIDTVLIPPAEPTIVDIAAADPRFTTLVSALQSQNLVGALSGAGPFTVFAPTNDAFAKLASVPGGEALTRVLKYHVASGKFSASDLSKLKDIQTLAGENIFISKQGNSLILNGLVKVIIADIQASNGVIHVIDTVLLPDSKVRAIHASFDAPAVDVLVNGQKAFQNVTFGTATDYATVPYGVADDPVVLEEHGFHRDRP